METKESDNLSRDELFEVLKGKCKSRARVNFYVTLVGLFIFIAFFIHTEFHSVQPEYDINHIILFIGFSLIVCAGGWLVVNNYWFLMKAVNLDTPERLLYWYDKKIRYDRITNYLTGVATLCMIWGGTATSLLVGSLLLIAFIAFMIIMYKTAEPIVSRRDQELISQLQELTEK